MLVLQISSVLLGLGAVAQQSGFNTCGTDACRGTDFVGGRGLLQVNTVYKDGGETTLSTTWASPYYMMNCPGTQAITTQRMTEADYDSITASITALYDSLPSIFC